jgi:hypothetical protein
MGANDNEIFSRLLSIDKTVSRIDERTEQMQKTDGDHEQRIRNLERESDKRKGLIAAVSSFGGIVGAGVMWLIKQIFGGN